MSARVLSSLGAKRRPNGIDVELQEWTFIWVNGNDPEGTFDINLYLGLGLVPTLHVLHILWGEWAEDSVLHRLLLEVVMDNHWSL